MIKWSTNIVDCEANSMLLCYDQPCSTPVTDAAAKINLVTNPTEYDTLGFLKPILRIKRDANYEQKFYLKGMNFDGS